MNVPKPDVLHAEYEIEHDRIRVVLHWRKSRYTPFLLLFVAVWTFPCLLAASAACADLSSWAVNGIVGCWGVWFAAALLLTYLLSRRDELVLNDACIRYSRRAIIPLFQRDVPLREVLQVQLAGRLVGDDQSPELGSIGIEIDTRGEPLQVLFGLPEEELRWTVNELNRVLSRLVTATTVEDGSSTDLAEPVPPPSDCGWSLVERQRELRFVQQGRWYWKECLGMLVAVCLWSGILISVVTQFKNGLDMRISWALLGRLAFLFVFGAIGALFFLVLAFLLLEPIRTSTWQFRDGEVECRWTWLFLGWRWRYKFDRLDGIRSIRNGPRRNDAGYFLPTGFIAARDDRVYRLLLVRSDYTKLCEIRDLTEGEADWMADRVKTAFPEWFPL